MSEAHKISPSLIEVKRPLAKHCNDTHRNYKIKISEPTKRIKCDYKLHHFCELTVNIRTERNAPKKIERQAQPRSCQMVKITCCDGDNAENDLIPASNSSGQNSQSVTDLASQISLCLLVCTFFVPNTFRFPRMEGSNFVLIYLLLTRQMVSFHGYLSEIKSLHKTSK
jgi:hypothetical protein